MVSLMSIETRKNILLLVEGDSSEVSLFSRILDCFPEIKINKNNILVYHTNLWVLNGNLKKEFGDDWYSQEIDFLEFLKSSPNLQNQIKNIDTIRITDIFLVFDYERQDPLFDSSALENLQRFFSNSTENGQLYINYPMIEAYKHLKKPFQDNDYLNRECSCSILTSKENKKNKYKQIVGDESNYKDLKKIQTEDFRQFVIHNLCKASFIIKGGGEVSETIAYNYWKNMNMSLILKKQNQHSEDILCGSVYVLCTCLFFIPDYKSSLIFSTV